jgi:low temperature requirement protein LtrA
MDFIKLNLSYLTSVNNGEYYVLNTNCSWWVWKKEGFMAKTFNHKTFGYLTVIVPTQMTEKNLMAIQVDGFEVEVTKVMKCRDGIGYLVHFKIR